MNFKDLLDRYNNGNVSKEEIKLVEEELDKYEAIADYLSESYSLDFEENILSQNPTSETNLVKKSVNKKLRKIILLSVSTVFLILFMVNYILSPIISSFYYNPAQKTVTKYHEDLYFDLRAITELNSPGHAINTAIAEKLGFGEYNIYFQRVNLFNRQIKDITAKIKKNYKSGSFQDFFASNNFVFLDIKDPNPIREDFTAKQSKETIEHMKELNPVSYISSYIVFDDDLSVKEFDELRKKYNDKINFKWAGVRTVAEGKNTNFLSGFNPNFNDGSVTGDTPNKNKYPYLQLVDYMTDEEARKNFNGSFEDAYTKHFMSLLRYVNDRQKSVEALDYSSLKIDYYKNALNYVENNGVNIYGVLIYGEAKEMLEFVNNEKIKSIEIDNVLPSKYIH